MSNLDDYLKYTGKDFPMAFFIPHVGVEVTEQEMRERLESYACTVSHIDFQKKRYSNSRTRPVVVHVKTWHEGYNADNIIWAIAEDTCHRLDFMVGEHQYYWLLCTHKEFPLSTSQQPRRPSKKDLKQRIVVLEDQVSDLQYEVEDQESAIKGLKHVFHDMRLRMEDMEAQFKKKNTTICEEEEEDMPEWVNYPTMMSWEM